MSPPFVIELLRLQHQRDTFVCGVEPLNRYFREQVSQDVRKRASACYVARQIRTDAVAAYYTLAASSILLSGLPQTLAKKLPRYPDVPVARLGRLAVDERFQGRKLGAAMLWDAIERAARSEVVVYGVVVDAKDGVAAAFYEHHGFVLLSARSRQLILPVGSLSRHEKNPK